MLLEKRALTKPIYQFSLGVVADLQASKSLFLSASLFQCAIKALAL
jgi:hypothetical protein